MASRRNAHAVPWITLVLVGTESHLPGQIRSDRESHATMPMAQDRHLGQGQNKSGLSALPTSNNSRPCGGWANVVPGKMASGGGGEGGQQSSNKGNEQRPPSKQARHFLTAQSFSPRSCCCCKLEKMRGWIGWYTAKTAKPQGANKINQTPKSSTTAGAVYNEQNATTSTIPSPPSFRAVQLRAAQKIVGEQQ